MDASKQDLQLLCSSDVEKLSSFNEKNLSKVLLTSSLEQLHSSTAIDWTHEATWDSIFRLVGSTILIHSSHSTEANERRSLLILKIGFFSLFAARCCLALPPVAKIINLDGNIDSYRNKKWKFNLSSRVIFLNSILARIGGKIERQMLYRGTRPSIVISWQWTSSAAAPLLQNSILSMKRLWADCCAS